jgi:hypothetical protein
VLLLADVIAVHWTWEGYILILKNGTVLSIVNEDCIECVPEGYSPLLAAVLSPDGDILALSDADGSLRLLECSSWSEIRRWNLSGDPDLQKKPVSVAVGWGSEETQFKGTGAAQARRQGKLQSENVPRTHHVTDDETVNISWRGDGDLLAVSHLTSSGERILRVFDRDGNHLHSSNPGTLERCLAWQPSGSCIASTLHAQDRLKIVFFEKNCLPWHNFDLLRCKSEGAFVKTLEWSPSSDVLALVLSTPDAGDSVQLWTRTNYHWDLKFSINLKHNFQTLLWGGDGSYKLHVVFDSVVDLYEFQPAVCTSNDHQDAWAAVVNGTNLRLTPLGKRVFPPPMCAQELRLEKHVLGVVFASTGTGLYCITEDRLFHYDSSTENGATGYYKLKKQYEFENMISLAESDATAAPGGVGFSKFSSWTAVGPNKLAAMAGCTPMLFELDETSDHVRGSRIIEEDDVRIEARDLCGSDGQLILLSSSNEVFRGDVATKSVSTTGRKLGSVCSSMLYDVKRELLFGELMVE